MIGCSTRETTEGLAGNAGVSGGLSEISAALACEEGSAVSPAQAEAQPPPSPQGAPPPGVAACLSAPKPGQGGTLTPILQGRHEG